VTVLFPIRPYDLAMVLRFGPFELDTDREELRRSGLVLRLPRQPSRLLLMFIRRAGEVVTREEIRNGIWGSETHVDFEQGINAAIRQIRFHLGDNAEVPRYLKTIPRKGYVWIAPVEEVVRTPEIAPIEPPIQPPKRDRRVMTLIILAVVAIAAGVLWFNYPRNRRTIAITPFRAIGALPPGVDPGAFTQELRSTIGALPRRHLVLRDNAVGGEAQVRIEGTIQADGGSLRVIVSGIDTASRTQLWSETYERRIGEHGDMAMQTAHLVAHEVMHRFLPPPRHEPLLRTKVPPRVLELYRRARFERSRSIPDPYGNHAAALFEQALREEPKFAEALSGIGDVWGERAQPPDAPNRGLAAAKARTYAMRALALQPDNPEARSQLGLLALQYDWNLTEAEQDFRKAVKDDPEYVDAVYNLSATLAARGEFDDSLELYEQARALDPLDFDLQPAEGMLYIRARRYDQAIAKYHEILRFKESMSARWGIVWASINRRDWDEATAALRTMLDLPPRPAGVAASEEEFRDLFRRLEPKVLASRSRGLVDDFHVAAYYSERGDIDLAFAALGRAFERRAPAIIYLLVDPRFDALRTDPRFRPFAARIK
jgi:DNA-binding winged helix-turn-helix (wHTH) protein/tetratricopeptide (TPR) repeat protein